MSCGASSKKGAMSRTIKPKTVDQLVVAGKAKIRTKIKDLIEEKNAVVNLLEDFILESEAIAQPLLNETDRTTFFQEFESLSQILEGRLSKFFVLRANLPQQLFSSDDDSEQSCLDEISSNSPSENTENIQQEENVSVPASTSFILNIDGSVTRGNTSLSMSDPCMSDNDFYISRSDILSEPDDIPVKLVASTTYLKPMPKSKDSEILDLAKTPCLNEANNSIIASCPMLQNVDETCLEIEKSTQKNNVDNSKTVPECQNKAENSKGLTVSDQVFLPYSNDATGLSNIDKSPLTMLQNMGDAYFVSEKSDQQNNVCSPKVALLHNCQDTAEQYENYKISDQASVPNSNEDKSHSNIDGPVVQNMNETYLETEKLDQQNVCIPKLIPVPNCQNKCENYQDFEILDPAVIIYPNESLGSSNTDCAPLTGQSEQESSVCIPNVVALPDCQNKVEHFDRVKPVSDCEDKEEQYTIVKPGSDCTDNEEQFSHFNNYRNDKVQYAESKTLPNNMEVEPEKEKFPDLINVDGRTKYSVQMEIFVAVTNFCLRLQDHENKNPIPCTLKGENSTKETELNLCLSECHRVIIKCSEVVFCAKSRHGTYLVEMYFHACGISINLFDYLAVWRHMQINQREIKEAVKLSSVAKQNYRDREGSVLQAVISDSSDRSSPEDKLEWDSVISVIPREEIIEQSNLYGIMSLAVHPEEFYMQIFQKYLVHFEDLQLKMNVFYENLVLPQPVYKRKVVHINSYWAARSKIDGDNNWYRVKVLSFVGDISDSSTGAKSKRKLYNAMTKILVLIIDYGNKYELMLKDLRPLCASFTSFPAYAICCSLHGAKSLVGDGESQKYTEHFRNIVTENKRVRIEALQLFNDDTYDVNLYMQHDENSGEVSVAEQLAAFGTQLNSEETTSLAENESMSRWNPMEEAYHSSRNKYTVEDDDVETAISGYKANDEKYICLSYRDKGFCRRGNRCNYEHIDVPVNSVATLDVEEEFTGKNAELPDENQCYYAMVSAAFSPCHFYVVFPFGYDPVPSAHEKAEKGVFDKKSSLEQLNEELNNYYEQKSRVDNSFHMSLAYGSLLAAKSKIDNRWYRAIAFIDNDVSGMVEVEFVDYGNRESIPRSHVRKIEPQFIHLNYQAVECFLDNVKLKTLESHQSEKAMKYFRELTEGKFVIIEVVSHGFNKETIEVNLKVVVDKLYRNVDSLLVEQGFAVNC